MRTDMLGVVLLAATLGSSVRGQTLEEVRQAVDGCVGLDESAEAARHSLHAWGNNALPFLRELAGRAEDATPLDRLSPIPHDGTRLVFAITFVDTPGAVELLVEMLDHKTLISPSQVLVLMQGTTSRYREQLQSHVRFQQLIFKFAKDGDGPLSDMAREQAARVMAEMGWEDGVPLLELMLQNEDLGVRQAAADALRSLTGRVVDAKKPDLVFPSMSPADVLALVANVDGSSSCGRLETWFDGQRALIRCVRGSLEAVSADGSARDRRTLPVGVIDVVSIPLQDHGCSWLVLGRDGDDDVWLDPDVALCVDRDCHELWRFTPEARRMQSACPLYTAEGCTGIAMGAGGAEGVVAFDLEGHELFRVPRTYVTYELCSHPRLPDTWLHCGGNLTLYDNHGQLVSRGPQGVARLAAEPEHLYASHAVLVPAADGTPAIVAAGSGRNSISTIACLDADLRPTWHASVPDRVTGLALVDPGDRPPCLAASTAAGELLVFDLEGTLRQRLPLVSGRQGRGQDPDVIVHSMSAGRLPDGRYGLAVSLSHVTLLYALQ